MDKTIANYLFEQNMMSSNVRSNKSLNKTNGDSVLTVTICAQESSHYLEKATDRFNYRIIKLDPKPLLM